MYEIDERDKVHKLLGVPQSSIGAPIPLVVSDELRTMLAYCVEDGSEAWTGDTVRVVGPRDAGEPIALVRFAFCYAHMLGPPGDEAFSGHPLASRGLEPYGAFEIENSSWISKLEQRNSVHPRHQPEWYAKRRHLIFTFHDTTFECVCDGFDVTLSRGSIASVVPSMVELLEWSKG